MDTVELLTDIETFIASHSMSESTFGREALNDWAFIKNLREGRRVWPETADRVRQFMAEYKKQDAAA